MSDYGKVQQVLVDIAGSSLSSAASVSDTSLSVDDATDFDSDGGILDLNGARLAYTSVAEGANPTDPDVLNLADPLAVAADEDDKVCPVVGGAIPEDWYAVVTMDGDGDVVFVPLSVDQRAQWPVGDYDNVPVTLSDDLQTLLDAPGRTVSTRNAFRNTDAYTYDGVAASVLLPLTKTPISGSEQPFWKPATFAVGGLGLPPGSWRIELPNLVIDDSDLMAEFDDGDLFWVDYAWDEALDDIQQEPEPTPTPDIIIAESFEHGDLGDFLRESNCPGLTYVYPTGNGIFIADPHSGAQAANLSNGDGTGGLSRSSVDLEAPVGATELGFWFKLSTPNPVITGSMANMVNIGWKPPGALSGSSEYARLDFVYNAPGSLHLLDSLGGYDDTTSYVPDTWYVFQVDAEGYWYISTETDTLISGHIDPIVSGRVLYASVTGEAHGYLIVDDFYYRPAPDVS